MDAGLTVGWNLIAKVDATNKTPVRSFIWGTDLGGSPQGPGGVGGLLAFTRYESPASTYFVAYDGNDNVSALVDGKTGMTIARNERIASPAGQGTHPNRTEMADTSDTTGAVRLGKRQRQLLGKEEAACRRPFCLLTPHANE